MPSDDENRVEADGADPINALFKAPGAIGRLILLALTISAIFLPAIEIHPEVSTYLFGPRTGLFDILTILPLSIIFTLVVILNVLTPAIAPLSKYTRLISLIGAVLGTIVFVMLIMTVAEISRRVGTPQTGAPVSLSFGAYAVLGSTIIMAAQVFLFSQKKNTEARS